MNRRRLQHSLCPAGRTPPPGQTDTQRPGRLRAAVRRGGQEGRAPHSRGAVAGLTVQITGNGTKRNKITGHDKSFQKGSIRERKTRGGVRSGVRITTPGSGGRTSRHFCRTFTLKAPFTPPNSDLQTQSRDTPPRHAQRRGGLISPLMCAKRQLPTHHHHTQNSCTTTQSLSVGRETAALTRLRSKNTTFKAPLLRGRHPCAGLTESSALPPNAQPQGQFGVRI